MSFINDIRAKEVFLHEINKKIQQRQTNISKLTPKVERLTREMGCFDRVLIFFGYKEMPLAAQQLDIESRVCSQLNLLFNNIFLERYLWFQSVANYCNYCIPDLILAMNIQKQILNERQCAQINRFKNGQGLTLHKLSKKQNKYVLKTALIDKKIKSLLETLNWYHQVRFHKNLSREYPYCYQRIDSYPIRVHEENDSDNYESTA